MEFKKTWEELQIRNDFLFAKVMRDKKICIALLETLLKTKITDIEYLEEQKTIDIDLDAKSIRLDVYVENGERVFDLEMQTTNKRDLPCRSRYYQDLIDLNTIEKGESYKRLKESYVIFICTLLKISNNVHYPTKYNILTKTVCFKEYYGFSIFVKIMYHNICAAL